MPPKAPAPAEFIVASLQAGKKQWTAGRTGPVVSFDMLGSAGNMQRHEVLLAGKILFGRKRLAFEVQQVDYSKAAIKKLVEKEKELDSRFGGYVSSDDDDLRMDFMAVHRARDLSARHSLQIKFDDIESVLVDGRGITLALSAVPACYLKPAGERNSSGAAQKGVCKDITGGARILRFVSAEPPSAKDKAKSFESLLPMLKASSPRLSAIFDGRTPPDPIATTPNEKKRPRSMDGEAGSSTKQAKRAVSVNAPLQEINAHRGSWLKLAVDRFGLKGHLDISVNENAWKTYVKMRVMLEAAEAHLAAYAGDSEDSADDQEPQATTALINWPECLGPKPSSEDLSRVLTFESYREDENEEHEFGLGVLEKIRKSLEDVMKSTSLKFEPSVVSRGAYLHGYHLNMDDDTPRTVNADAILFAPTGSGNYLAIGYENHYRARMSFTERHTFMWCKKKQCGGLPVTEHSADTVDSEDSDFEEQQPRRGKAKGGDGRIMLFSMDFNEYRRKSPYQTKFVTNKQLQDLGCHLFGEGASISPRKVFMLLVRASGIGHFGEVNGWPIAAARRRFKCAKNETATDTESISGDKVEDPGHGEGCCIS